MLGSRWGRAETTEQSLLDKGEDAGRVKSSDNLMYGDSEKKTMMVLTPPLDRTLSDQVVRQLRTQIILGHLPPGTRLTEQALVDALHVSRSTVREALRRLEGEGLIELHAHRGARVAELQPTDAYELCELHALLGEYCARHLPLPIPAALRAELARIIGQMRALQLPEEVDRFLDLDHAFHGAIVRALGQRRVLQFWSELNALLGILVTLTFRYSSITGPRTAARHQAVLDALTQTDRAVAAAALADHYRSLEDEIRRAAELHMEQSKGGGTR